MASPFLPSWLTTTACRYGKCMPMNRLRELRQQRGLTLEQVADELGTTPATIHRLETGKRQLTEKWIRRLAAFYRVHPGEILEPLPTLTDEEKRVLQKLLEASEPA